MGTIWESRPGRWTAQVGERKGGKSKTFTSKTEARRWAKRMAVEIEAGKAPATGHTFNDIIEEQYLAHVEEHGGMSRSRPVRSPISANGSTAAGTPIST